MVERVADLLFYSKLFAGIAKAALYDSVKSVIEGDLTPCYENGLNTEQINEIVRAVNIESENY